ncbi:MAG: NAD(P)-binding protein [Gammaproteobacteria bacterium]|nr:NAD(P)-binding protein [Gammaproteobacteria bacterium]
MDRAITRRDFLNGVSVAIGASLLPACTKTGEPMVEVLATYYPPAETGMRGSHAGSFEVAHATVQGKDWVAGKTDEHYDLIVVGAGISGLSAAYIYRRDVNPNARILILDNHDDFGGHAKRNEFTLDGRMFIGYGGTMFIEAPQSYPAVSKQVIREIGIDTSRSAEFYHDDLFASHGLSEVSFFDRETFGADLLASGAHGFGNSMEELPLSAEGKAELERLFADKVDYLEGKTPAERSAVLETHSWLSYLKTYGGFGEEVLAYVQKLPHGYWAIGADAMPAAMARDNGNPGFGVAGSGGEEESGDELDDRGFFSPTAMPRSPACSFASWFPMWRPGARWRMSSARVSTTQGWTSPGMTLASASAARSLTCITAGVRSMPTSMLPMCATAKRARCQRARLSGPAIMQCCRMSAMTFQMSRSPRCRLPFARRSCTPMC